MACAPDGVPGIAGQGRCIDSGTVKSACETVLGQLLKLLDMHACGGGAALTPSAIFGRFAAAKKISGTPSETGTSPQSEQVSQQLA